MCAQKCTIFLLVPQNLGFFHVLKTQNDLPLTEKWKYHLWHVFDCQFILTQHLTMTTLKSIWAHELAHISTSLSKNAASWTRKKISTTIFTKKVLLLYSYNLAFPPHHYCIGWKEVRGRPRWAVLICSVSNTRRTRGRN